MNGVEAMVELRRLPSWKLEGLVALSLSLSVALLDLVRGVALQAVQPMSWLALVGPIAALFGFVLLAYPAVLGLLIWPLRRLTSMDPVARAFAVAALIGVPVALRVLGWNAALPERGHPRSWFLPLLIGAAAFLVTRWAVEGAGREVPAGRWLFGACLGAPVVLLEALAFFWLRQQFEGTSVVFDGLGGLLLAAAAVASASYFSRSAGRCGAALVALSLALVGGTVALWAVEAGLRDRLPSGNGPPDGPVPRVVLISIDTLRRDALSIFGADTPTPNLDALARDGIRFDNAYSPAPWTAPAFASIMTGVSPWAHEVLHFTDTMPPALPTLARRFHDAGYLTAATGFNFFLTRHRSKGTMSAGFDSYDFGPKHHRPMTFSLETLARLDPVRFAQVNDTEDATRRAEAWVRANRDRGFFFWLHYFDPHGPYDPPADFYPPGEPDPIAGPAFGREDEIFDLRLGDFRPTPRTIEWIRELYQGEVRYVDDRVGRFVATLKELGIYEDALIVVTSDHGEEFYEHEGIDHGHTLYEELLQVPLIVKLPGRSIKDARVGQRISTVSLSPTILDICGIAYDPQDFEGASLVPLWQPGAERQPDRPVFSTGMAVYRDRRAVIFDGFKYIRFDDGTKEELYDLASDPGETNNLAGSDPGRVEEGLQLLGIALKHGARIKQHHGLAGSGTQELDEEELELMRSLGYVN